MYALTNIALLAESVLIVEYGHRETNPIQFEPSSSVIYRPGMLLHTVERSRRQWRCSLSNQNSCTTSPRSPRLDSTTGLALSLQQPFSVVARRSMA